MACVRRAFGLRSAASDWDGQHLDLGPRAVQKEVMRPLTELSSADVLELELLAFDLDDTFFGRHPNTGRLVLDPSALQSLYDLQAAGLALAVVTGRPAGFADVAMRTWPLAFAVAENGAARFRYVDAKLETVSREGSRARSLEVAELLCQRYSVKLADDNVLRRVDVTIDIGDHDNVSEHVISLVISDARAAGLRCFRSSIHLHLTEDAYDKASGLIDVVRRVKRDPTDIMRTTAFVGDSENDRSAFSAFRTSFGVANLSEHLHGLTVPPAFVATQPTSRGFVEIAQAIVAKRT